MVYSRRCMLFTWLVSRQTAVVTGHVLCTPYSHAPCRFLRSHIRRMHASLAVTCHLHFWQNDRNHYLGGTKSHDSVHKPQLSKRDESRSGIEPRSFCLPTSNFTAWPSRTTQQRESRTKTHRSNSTDSEFRSCVKVEVDVQDSPSATALTVSVDVKQH